MTKNIFISLTLLPFFVILLSNKKRSTDKNSFEYAINDSTKITIREHFDSGLYPPYYFSNMTIPACNTGECMLINITMYWDAFGNYLMYSVPKDANLTKYNHKKFKKKEYIKLHKILNNPDAKYSKFTIDNLTEKQAKDKYKVDATSGSTIKLIYDSERIKGAVKTTHTLWNIANGEIKTILAERTKKKYPNFHGKNIFKTKIDEGKIKVLESEISKNDKIMSMLISNYFLRNNIKSKKVKNFLKHFKFTQD